MIDNVGRSWNVLEAEKRTLRQLEAEFGRRVLGGSSTLSSESLYQLPIGKIQKTLTICHDMILIIKVLGNKMRQ